jgi:hypothetical protein
MDQVSHVEGSLSYVAVVIEPQLLLISRVPHQRGYVMFFNAVEVDLACFLGRPFLVVLDARGTEGYVGWEDRL